MKVVLDNDNNEYNIHISNLGSTKGLDIFYDIVGLSSNMIKCVIRDIYKFDDKEDERKAAMLMIEAVKEMINDDYYSQTGEGFWGL